MSVLHRLLAYCDQIAALPARLGRIRDQRSRPRIPTAVVLRSVVVMFMARLGSLHALEQTQESAFWRRWLGRALPSADSLGRIVASVDLEALRELLHGIYTSLRRAKALAPTSHGLMAVVLDGHESHATYRRCCAGCLERAVKTKRGWQRQFYHQSVTAMLLGRDFPLLLDLEPLRREGEEIEAALRLLERLVRHYPRAFEVVVGDALYADPRIVHFLRERGKDVVTVLKRNQPDLLADAHALFDASSPGLLVAGSPEREVWDASGFTTWPQVGPVRVVRSRETTRIRRQLEGAPETLLAEWLWVTTLSAHRAPTLAVVELGHARWEIENRAFNEVAHRWPFDHVYKHHPIAMLAFILLAMAAYNLCLAFYHRHLQPAYRRRVTALHVARSAASELYAAIPVRAPP